MLSEASEWFADTFKHLFDHLSPPESDLTPKKIVEISTLKMHILRHLSYDLSWRWKMSKYDSISKANLFFKSNRMARGKRVLVQSNHIYKSAEAEF